MTKNQIEWLKLQEDIRSNKAREAETYRSNTATEQLTQWRDTTTAELRDRELAQTITRDWVNAQIGAYSLGETIRSNQAREQELQRSNLAKEAETMRHNLQQEQIGFQQASAAQTSAAAAWQNSLANLQNAETNRFTQEFQKQQGQYRLGLEQQAIAETHRTNVAKETETTRANTAREAETYRTNVANEAIKEFTSNWQYDIAAQNIDIGQQNADANSKQASYAGVRAWGGVASDAIRAGVSIFGGYPGYTPTRLPY